MVYFVRRAKTKQKHVSNSSKLSFETYHENIDFLRRTEYNNGIIILAGGETMANIKYIRVSTQEQNTARQETDTANFDRVFIEKVSGKDTNRPQLNAMLDYVREGDVVTVESYSRLARNTRDLLNIIDALNKKGVAFVSQKEQIDTSTPAGRFMLSVFASLAQFEREQILARQAEGIALAKREGRMGRPSLKTSGDFSEIVAQWRRGEFSAVEAMKRAGMSKASFYRKVKETEKAGS